jgi:hypothetical protein
MADCFPASSFRRWYSATYRRTVRTSDPCKLPSIEKGKDNGSSVTLHVQEMNIIWILCAEFKSIAKWILCLY